MLGSTSFSDLQLNFLLFTEFQVEFSNLLWIIINFSTDDFSVFVKILFVVLAVVHAEERAERAVSSQKVSDSLHFY